MLYLDCQWGICQFLSLYTVCAWSFMFPLLCMTWPSVLWVCGEGNTLNMLVVSYAWRLCVGGYLFTIWLSLCSTTKRCRTHVCWKIHCFLAANMFSVTLPECTQWFALNTRSCFLPTCGHGYVLRSGYCVQRFIQMLLRKSLFLFFSSSWFSVFLGNQVTSSIKIDQVELGANRLYLKFFRCLESNVKRSDHNYLVFHSPVLCADHYNFHTVTHGRKQMPFLKRGNCLYWK